MGIFAQALQDVLWRRRAIADPSEHLAAAMSWLCRAQDMAGGGGVARMYHLKTGWGAAYPETTGYIIPTFLQYARWSGKEEFKRRALRMADWEIEVQMPSGAVQGGTIASPPSPAIFNTGQVIFGWVAAYRETGDRRYLDALTRAADFLCAEQDEDGAWRRNLSEFCRPRVKTDSYCYNVRTAWALQRAAEITGEERYRRAAERNLEYVIRRTHPNGWTSDNCLNDPERPLLHTIAYTTQGMLELSLALGSRRGLELVCRANRALLEALERDGRLSGRYDADWRPCVRWRCLTGEAQTAVVWFVLATALGNDEWRHAGLRLNQQLKATQALRGNPDIVGGIKGSHPVFGGYGKYQYLNWATKFYADALMQEAGVREAGRWG